MPKPVIIAVAVVGAVVVIGGGIVLGMNLMKGSTPNNTGTSDSASGNLVDPDGTYKFFSDPSVTKYPEKNALYGNGQTFTFEYDGSKTNNDPDATLSFQLYYIQADGKVQPMGGGNLEGTGKGTFTVTDSVFDSSAKDAYGFFELIGTYDTSLNEATGITGKNVTLGMYPIKFDIAE